MAHDPRMPDALSAPAPHIPANRAAGLSRLDQFLPRAGRLYAETRNFDLGPDRDNTASGLAPFIRHRLITEAEVVHAAIAAHGAQAASKFIDEVFWRTYWKGWLQMRPTIWADWQQDLTRLDASDPMIRQAERGETGIACFDHWAQTLVATGYLHNHARMWFASLWIFALGLPWQLGAAFFLRHLLDGDPASNTLSWRWVAGLHTPGKCYLATPDNIETFTKGRFRPAAFRPHPAPAFVPHPPPIPITATPAPPPGPALLIVTEEDLHPESLPLGQSDIQAVAALAPSTAYAGPQVRAFRQAALIDALTRASAHFNVPMAPLSAPLHPDDGVIAQAKEMGVHQILTAQAPVGPMADRLSALAATAAGSGLRLHQVRRVWDSQGWPLATKGFFAFRQHIPALIEGDGGA